MHKTGSTRVLAYVRVSTDEQSHNGFGLQAQEQTLRDEVGRRGWQLVDVVRDEGSSGRTLDRPGLHDALTRAAQGEADCLMVARLDRLVRSSAGLADLLEWLASAKVALVALDLGIDSTSPVGRLVVSVMGAVAEWERQIISERTLVAAAVRRRQGLTGGLPGVRDTMPEVAERIRAARGNGVAWQRIADGLNLDGVPTVRGGSGWRVSSVQSSGGYLRPPAKVKRGVLPDVPRRAIR